MTQAETEPASRGGAQGEEDPGRGAGKTVEEQGPVGTLFVLMVYLMVLAGMWATMYWMLVSR